MTAEPAPDPRNEPPGLAQPYADVRYSRWDGTQRLDALEAEELLGAMADELLSGGDLEDAMARLARWGIPGRMEGLKDLQELLKELQQQVLGSYFKNMRDALRNLTPEQLERTRQMIRDLNRALRERMEGGEPDFEAFQRQYPELAGNAKDWDDLLRQLAQGMAAMRSLWQSMSSEMQQQLEELLGAAFSDPGLQQAMNELAETLSQLMPTESYEHSMSGDESITLAEALGLMDEMNQLSDMEDVVRGARAMSDLDPLDPD